MVAQRCGRPGTEVLAEVVHVAALRYLRGRHRGQRWETYRPCAGQDGRGLKPFTESVSNQEIPFCAPCRISQKTLLRGRYFTAPYPTDTIVEVSFLYSPKALIESEAIAVSDAARE